MYTWKNVYSVSIYVCIYIYVCVCVCVYTYIYLYIVHWSWVLFKASVFLLIFWLDDLSIDVTGVFKVLYYYCVTVNFSIYLLIFMYLGAPLLDACVCVCVCVCVCGLSHSVVTRPFHLWNFPGKDAGAGCHFLYQGIFPTQGSNQCLCISCISKWILYHQCHLGSPIYLQFFCLLLGLITWSLCNISVSSYSFVLKLILSDRSLATPAFFSFI